MRVGSSLMHVMHADLGTRFVESGLITREMLAKARLIVPRACGGPFAKELVRLGLTEQAIVGWMVARGYGPVVRPETLAAANPKLVELLPSDVARELLALPLREGPSEVFVALADPSDARAVMQLETIFNKRVVARVAPVRALNKALSDWYDAPDDGDEEGTRPGIAPTSFAERLTESLPADDPDREPTGRVERHSVSFHASPTRSYARSEFEQRALEKVEPPSSGSPAHDHSSAASFWSELTGLRAQSEPRLGAVQSPVRRPSSAAPKPVSFSDALDDIRQCRDVNKLAKLVCGAGQLAARTIVLLKYRDLIFQGWEISGAGLDRDHISSLRIPSGTESVFHDVVASGAPYSGPHGTTPSDALFRIATHSAGKSLYVHPIVIGRKLVAALCADDVAIGDLGAPRLAELARAMTDSIVEILRLRASQR
jgi:hypothetical protein